MFENLKVEAGKSVSEVQINVLISILSSLFCFLFVRLFLRYGYLLVASICSIGITTYGVTTFYYIISFYELKENENETLASVMKGIMYVGIFLLFLVILSQLVDVSDLVKTNKGMAVPSLVIGLVIIFIPKILWSEVKGLIKKKDMKKMTPFSLPISNLTRITTSLPALYNVIRNTIRPTQILPKIVGILYNFASRLGLNPLQSNLFVFSLIIGFFYVTIKFLEVIIKWILFLLILGLLISVMSGAF